MTSELEYRTATLGEVSYPRRQIELVVMPYETPTVVAYRGREIVEVCSRGAYDGIEERNNQVRVNRDHDLQRTCGRAVAFHPSRDEGLVAELYIARTELGDETLTLADERMLDASAGFQLLLDKQTGRVKQRAEVWETRNVRRLNHLWLGHIALVPEPAYDTANVLAVRHAEPVGATPNLDRLRLDELRQQYEDLDRRYIPG